MKLINSHFFETVQFLSLQLTWTLLESDNVLFDPSLHIANENRSGWGSIFSSQILNATFTIHYFIGEGWGCKYFALKYWTPSAKNWTSGFRILQSILNKCSLVREIKILDDTMQYSVTERTYLITLSSFSSLSS